MRYFIGLYEGSINECPQQNKSSIDGSLFFGLIFWYEM